MEVIPDQLAEGAEPLEKRRGRARRVRRSLKYKYRAIRLLEKIRVDLTEAADEEGHRPPTITDIIAVVRAHGLSEPESNLFRWLKEKDKLVQAYADKRARKQKSLGAGRGSALPVTEARVKEMIMEKRAQNLRVPKTLVKAWIKEHAEQLEPAVAKEFKFSAHYYSNAFRRMRVIVRRISSSKSIKNEDAAQYGRYFCRKLMELREKGYSADFADQTWCAAIEKDSVFGFFPPDFVFAADEVPFNFAEDGSTVTGQGMDAAVRSLRGTGKRFGSCVVICSAAGDLLDFVLIFKAGKKGLPAKELEKFAQYPHVHVTYTRSSYINEQIWRNTVIGKVLFNHIQAKFGRDFSKRRYLFLSDNHSSHQTAAVLEECKRNGVFPCFTPPNFTTHWSMIDDYVGTAARAEVYQQALKFEMDYFEKNPNGDGGIPIAERRELVVKWWSKAFESLQAAKKRELRWNAARRVGLWVTATSPADTAYRPNPVRFHGTAYRFFGEILYDPSHPDYAKVKEYHFSFPDTAGAIATDELQAEDEDGKSQEDHLVWNDDEDVGGDEEDDKIDSEEELEMFQHIIAKSRSRRADPASSGIVAQYDRLEAVDGRKRRKK